jgi:hypothetical protein
MFAAGETGSDVEHFVSTSVSVLLLLPSEFELRTFVEPSVDDGFVPFSRAGRIFVSVRCDDD